MKLERALKALRDEHTKLTTINEYLDRQIVFLRERATQFETDKRENLSTLAEIEELIERLDSAFGR